MTRSLLVTSSSCLLKLLFFLSILVLFPLSFALTIPPPPPRTGGWTELTPYLPYLDPTNSGSAAPIGLNVSVTSVLLQTSSYLEPNGKDPNPLGERLL